MTNLRFDSNGRFIGFKDRIFTKRRESSQPSPHKRHGQKHTCQICGRPINHQGNCLGCNIRNKKASEQATGNLLNYKFKTSEGNKPVKAYSSQKFDNSQDTEYWSLYKNGQIMPPLKFSNNKTQEDVVEEVVNLIKGGTKIIFMHGVCGTGKSAIALNIARVLGKAAVVVPVKGLQRQYKEDYMEDMFLLKENGEKLKISMITGRANHDSVFEPGISCADPYLPDTIQIIERNFRKIKEYYEKNPFIEHKNIYDLTKLKRISIAPVNPYWSPIIPSKYTMNLPDAKKKLYKGLRDTEFIFYHRKKGCSYYDQYDAYFDSDVIIFNAAKYKIETAMDRKPETEIDIIDEADEFLDSFSNQSELNLTRLKHSLASLYSEHEDIMDIIDKMIELIKLEEKNKKATGIDENKIFHIDDTNMRKILSLAIKDGAIESETHVDDPYSNYVRKVLEVAKEFEDFYNDTYLTYRVYEKNLYVNLVTTNMSKRMQEMLDKNKAFVFMSGTLHSKIILEKVFGITNYKIVEAETIPPGTIEIHQTGKEFDCKYSNFKLANITRENYLDALSVCSEKALRPTLVHVNAFMDLPSDKEIHQFSLKDLISREELLKLQERDKTGKLVSDFKKKLFNIFYSTKCSRGVDFPGDSCCSVLFTKYPNPNPQNTFWKVLKKTHPDYFWDFYKDKARREFLQRLYRALRSPKDHVFVLSPDSRVLDAVRNLQVANKTPNF